MKIKKPVQVCAPKYMDYLMDWIETQLDDESIFPQKFGKFFVVHYIWIKVYIFMNEYGTGVAFPCNFEDVVKTMFKRLFRVYAHIYHSHFQKIVALKEEAHLNTCFKHFVLFTWVSSVTCV